MPGLPGPVGRGIRSTNSTSRGSLNTASFPSQNRTASPSSGPDPYPVLFNDSQIPFWFLPTNQEDQQLARQRVIVQISSNRWP